MCKLGNWVMVGAVACLSAIGCNSSSETAVAGRADNRAKESYAKQVEKVTKPTKTLYYPDGKRLMKNHQRTLHKDQEYAERKRNQKISAQQPDKKVKRKLVKPGEGVVTPESQKEKGNSTNPNQNSGGK